jgi:poly [ADP-ribose] polymerase
MVEKTKDFALLTSGHYTVDEVKELNFFDLTGEKASCKGTSAKQYRAELQVSNDKTSAQIFTMWGPTGGRQTSDWRHYQDVFKAKKEFDSIIKSKLKKGYVEVDVAIRAFGSDEAKKITKHVELTNSNHLNIVKSSLHSETQRLISSLMKSTNQFVIQTLKCPLGQLSNSQIDLGRSLLKQAKTIVESKVQDDAKILQLTNQFYSAIPHNLGSGFRGKMDHLLLNDVNKILSKEYDLDTLLDAKEIGAVLAADAKIDDQYNSLNADLQFIDKQTDLFNWIEKMVLETRANNHSHLGKIKVNNAWKIARKGERDNFLKMVKEVSETSTRAHLPPMLKNLVPNRPDMDESCSLYPKTNTWPLFHGTRTQNMTGIMKGGLLIRPSGAVVTGAMFDRSGGLYFSTQASKSLNYTSVSTSYWAKGSDKFGYLFITDVCVGNYLVPRGPYGYTLDGIKPNHSVYAIGGKSGVINDEIITYTTHQSSLRMVVEVECQ